MSFSIVIPTYRRHEDLCSCLDCLAHYFAPGLRERLGFRIEVIVSDDARDPELKSLVARLFPWCEYIEGPSRGPAANRNHGAQHATTEWLVFTDDDCVPQPGWIEAYAATSDEYDVLEGRTSPLGVRSRADEECPINETGGFLWSCNFAIRRHIFSAVGGFDENFPTAAMEDVELNTRVIKAGLRRRFVMDALVCHPWRRRKGRAFVRAYSLSVAHFVRRHPDAAVRFSVLQLLMAILRSLKRNPIHAVMTGCFPGLFRQMFLDCYSSFSTWKAIYLKR